MKLLTFLAASVIAVATSINAQSYSIPGCAIPNFAYALIGSGCATSPVDRVCICTTAWNDVPTLLIGTTCTDAEKEGIITSIAGYCEGATFGKVKRSNSKVFKA